MNASMNECMDESINAWMHARRSDNNGCGKLEASCVLDQCARNESLGQHKQEGTSLHTINVALAFGILYWLDSCRAISYDEGVTLTRVSDKAHM